MAKRGRVDWRTRRAPAVGSRERAAYERSAVYRERQAAAAKARRTRGRNAAAREKEERARSRRLEKALAKARAIEDAKREKKARDRARRGRIEAGKALLEPLLTTMLTKADPSILPDFWKATRSEHANWYKAKTGLGAIVPESEYTAILEALSDDFDLEEIPWDIIY